MRGPAIAAVAVAVAAITGGAVVAAGSDRAPAVVVRDEAGRELVRAALPDPARFALEYRHSYYGARARESFHAGHGPGFEVAAIESPSEAVLDYYSIDGRKRTSRDGWIALVPASPRRYRRLSLIATPTGRRTLAVGDRRFPLSAPGRAAHLTLSVDRGSPG